MNNTLMILMMPLFTLSNGISFQSLSLSAQHRQYRGDDTASCEIRVTLSNKKNYFGNSAVMKGNRKATCADLNSSVIADFISPETNDSIHAQLIINAGNRVWSNANEDMDHGESPSNVLSCKIYINNVQNTALDTLCYSISQNRGFSTKE